MSNGSDLGGSRVGGFHARREFARLARFGANILDAHSCFIFLPRAAVAALDVQVSFGGGYSNAGAPANPDHDELVLIGAHSLSQKFIPDCVVHAEGGLVGWVARHGHPIHVSPFEHDSRTLGTYSEDQQLKSFIAVPLPIPVAIGRGRGGSSFSASASSPVLNGVLAADSKKAFAFSKLQGKLLEELSEQASSLIVVALAAIEANQDKISLETFFERADRFLSVMGGDAVEALRITPANLAALERDLGLAHVDNMMRQLYRLFEQSLPPNTPVYISPSGDLLCLVDNMMSSYFEGKAQALAEHVSGGSSRSISFRFQRSGLSRRRGEVRTVAELLAATIESARGESGERSASSSRAGDIDNQVSSVVPFGRFLRKVV